MKNKITHQTTLIFSLCAGAFILSTTVHPYAFSWIVKLLPMVVLIFLVSKFVNTTGDKLFLAGLLFSSLGDFLLDYDRINWFVYGLSAFLVAHLFYMLSLTPISSKRIKFAVLYMLYGGLVFMLVKSGLNNLFLPVFAYMLVLLLMAICTLLSVKSNNWLIAGGISFVLSDSLIAIDKFYQPIAYAPVLIMLSYYFAQYALVRGYLKT